jgi:beta-galactosidase
MNIKGVVLGLIVVAAQVAPALAQTASSQDIVIFTSDVPASAVHGSWSVQPDASAAGGIMLATPDNGLSTAAAPMAAPADYIDAVFDAPADVPYRVWLRLRAAGDTKWNDSVWVQFSDALVSGSPAYALSSTDGLLVNLENCSGCGVAGWGWQDRAWWLGQTSTVSFAAGGSHTLRIQVREDGVELDQIVLSPNRFLSAAPGSIRNDTTIVSMTQAPAVNLATGRPAVASSIESAAYVPARAVDGDMATRWSSEFADPQWIYVDLGSRVQVNHVTLGWEVAYAAAYQVQVSDDAQTWTTIFTTASGDGGVDDLTGLDGVGRYVRVLGTRRATPWGYSLWELAVDGAPAGESAPPINTTQPPTNPPPPPANNTPPVAELTAPANGNRYAANANVWMSANAWDADGIAGVDFYVDGALVSTDTTVPYQMLWSAAAPGVHQVMAVATDVFGARASTGVANIAVGSYPVPVARNRPAGASSAAGTDAAAAAFDGSSSTSWSSAAGGSQSVSVDLGETIGVDQFVVRWANGAYASSYQIQYSTRPDFTDGGALFATTTGDGDTDVVQLSGVPYVRYVRLLAAAGPSPAGYSIAELEIYRTLRLTLPSTPTATNPANASDGNRRDPALDWSAPYATSSDLYLGTSNPPALFAANLQLPSYRLYTLAPGTTYYWQVVARSEGGTTAGPVWSFRTGTTPPAPSPNLALNSRAYASIESAGSPASAAADGNFSTRWTSPASADPQWIVVDLGVNDSIDRLVLGWDTSYAAKYDIQVSADGRTWTTVLSNESGTGGMETIPLAGVSGRFVRVRGRQASSADGYSLNEIEVYGR